MPLGTHCVLVSVSGGGSLFDKIRVVPEAVKNWVALEAYKLSLPDSPPVTSEPIPTIGTIQYSRPASSQVERLQDGILDCYFRRVGSLG